MRLGLISDRKEKLERAQKIERYTKGGEKEFHNDTTLQETVIRNFEIIVKRRSECQRCTASATVKCRGVSDPRV
jgi:hypothetical protein